MKKKGWLLLFITLIVSLSIAALILMKTGREEAIEITKGRVSQGELILKVTARGKIEAEERFELKSKIPGVLTSILEEGSPVRKEKIVAVIDDKELLARQGEQEAALAATQAELKSLKRGSRLKELEEEVNAARVSFNEASRQFLSAKRLFETGAASEDKLKTIEAEYEKAKIGLDMALLRHQEEQDQQQERIDTLTAKIAGIRAGLDSIAQQIGWARVTSPVDGLVIQRSVKKDTYVLQGQLLSVVTARDRFVIKAEIDEVDIAKMAPGMKAEVTADAFPGKIIPGIITKIAPSPLLKEKINTFEVTITLQSAGLALRSEMLSDVTIISRRKSNVLKVPYEAVFSLDGKNYCLVVEENRTIKREVTLGLHNPTEVEVLSGLTAGQEVVLNPPLDLKDGARVRLKKHS